MDDFTRNLCKGVDEDPRRYQEIGVVPAIILNDIVEQLITDLSRADK